jgi:hypothetical protein
MLELKRIRLRTAGALAAIIAIAPAAVAHATSGTETIKAHPKSVMINTDTTIAGHGFPANTMITLTECGATMWLAPNKPCNTENVTTVETNTKGSFKAPFEMKLCPEGQRAHQPTTIICYVGVKYYVEDVGKLEPAAKVKVSYP